MPHLSELHGASTHLAVVAVPVCLLLLVPRLRGRQVVAAEPWVLGAAVLGVAASGITGLLVRGQSSPSCAEATRLSDDQLERLTAASS